MQGNFFFCLAVETDCARARRGVKTSACCARARAMRYIRFLDHEGQSLALWPATFQCKIKKEFHHSRQQARSLATSSTASTAQHSCGSMANGNERFSPPANRPQALQVQTDRRRAGASFFLIIFGLLVALTPFPFVFLLKD